MADYKDIIKLENTLQKLYRKAYNVSKKKDDLNASIGNKELYILCQIILENPNVMEYLMEHYKKNSIKKTFPILFDTSDLDPNIPQNFEIPETELKSDKIFKR